MVNLIFYLIIAGGLSYLLYFFYRKNYFLRADKPKMVFLKGRQKKTLFKARPFKISFKKYPKRFIRRPVNLLSSFLPKKKNLFRKVKEFFAYLSNCFLDKVFNGFLRISKIRLR